MLLLLFSYLLNSCLYRPSSLAIGVGNTSFGWPGAAMLLMVMAACYPAGRALPAVYFPSYSRLIPPVGNFMLGTVTLLGLGYYYDVTFDSPTRSVYVRLFSF